MQNSKTFCQTYESNYNINFIEDENCFQINLLLQIEDQKKFLTSHSFHVGMGTPQRIKVLIDDNSLKLSNLRWIVIDWSFVDVKKRRLIDFDDIRNELFSLMQKHLLLLTESNKLTFLLL